MQGLVFKSICQMGVFMICAQAIVHFRPDRSYEKYMKLLVSVMILVQIFQPIGRLFRGGGQEEFWERMRWFQKQLEQGMEQAQGDAARSEELLEEMTLRQVQERLEQEEGSSLEHGLEQETSRENGMSWESGQENGMSQEDGQGNSMSQEDGQGDGSLMETGHIPPVEKIESVKIE